MDDHEHDPYWKLRPPRPTPAEELCSCPDSPAVVLQPHLSANPLVCMACNLELPPERLGFSEALAEKLAFWQTFHDCFFHLWLDSAEFESWARAQLEDTDSPVNKRGRELVSELNTYWPAYYWSFQDSRSADLEPLSGCPACGRHLTERHGRAVCEDCSILVAK
jgi:hypothetical protein